MLVIRVAGSGVAFGARTLTIEDALDEPSTASFVVLDEDGSLEFRRGQPVEVDEDSVAVFRGFVSRATTEEVAGVAARHTLECVDNHYLADKRIVARAWEDVTAGDVVRDIIVDWLADEGVTEGQIDDGPPVSRWAAVYEPASEVIAALAERSDFHWRIDRDRKLHFHARDKVLAPWALSIPDDEVEAQAILERGNDRYRNVQWVVGGLDRTDEQVETFVGDGERQTFNVSFPVATLPIVKVNDVAQTVGVRGIDDDTDWFFSHRSTEISQDTQASPLGAGDTLEVAYVGLFETVTRSDIGPEIDDRKTIEGGDTSGQVESVHVDQRLGSRQEMFDRAAGKLEKFARVGRTLTFVTLREGLEAGQLLTVTYPLFDLDGAEMLLDRVVATERAPGALQWEVHAVEGPVQGSWVAWFRGVARRDALQVLENIAEDQVLTRLFQFANEWTENDDQPANFWFEVWPADTLMPATDLWPQIDPEHWLTHIEWWKDSSPLGRKQATTRDVSEAQIASTFYLQPFAAPIVTDELRFYSGLGAGQTLESGVLTIVESHVESKSTAEAWQIERDDTRAAEPAGWWEIGDVP